MRLPVVLLLITSIRAEDAKLISVQMVIRHAERAPITGFTSSSSARFFPRGLGEISDKDVEVGIRHSAELGRMFRQRYLALGLLKESTGEDEIFIRSSPVTRSLVSAASFSSAFFGRSSTCSIPIIHTTKNKTAEKVLTIPDSLSFRCKALAKHRIKDRMCSTNLLKQKIVRSYSDCVSFDYDLINAAIAEIPHAGVKIDHRLRKCAIDQGMNIKYHVLSILPGVGREFNLRRVRDSVGNLLAIVERNIDRAVHDAPKESIRIYYTHDYTILALAEALGIISSFNERAPEFSAAIMLETWLSKDGRARIKVILKNGNHNPFKVVAKFDLSNFNRHISPFIEKDARKVQWDEDLTEIYGNDQYQKDRQA